MGIDPRRIASDWLAECTSALAATDVDAFAALLLPDGWMRDFLVFTWDIRALAGRDKIAAYLRPTLARAQIAGVRLDESTHLAPRAVPLRQMGGTLCVELAFVFECAHGHGRAHVRLVEDAEGAYRAVTLFVELADLVGHEELTTMPLRDDLTGIPGRDMQKEFEEWVHEVETEPYVLIGELPQHSVLSWLLCSRRMQWELGRPV